jgi:FixJ family two-component response regulator
MFPSRATICVVDDEESVRKSLRRLLRSVGFDAETFASGREFLDSLKRRRPDCVILDFHLPEVSGLEVQEQLSREKMSLPVIMITGRDDPGLSERVLASGAAAYLRKPLDQEALLAAITSAVPERCAGEERESENLETLGAVLANEPSINGEIK